MACVCIWNLTIWNVIYIENILKVKFQISTNKFYLNTYAQTFVYMCKRHIVLNGNAYW